MDRNLIAFLDMLAACEGTSGPDGYRMIFGGELVDDLSAHPFANGRAPIAFKQTDGTIGHTTAAGRYQALLGTWRDGQRAISLKDFSPGEQDRFAVWRIQYRGATDDVTAGQLQDAIDKCGLEWASLPSSRYMQPKRTPEFAYMAFADAGGTVA